REKAKESSRQPRRPVARPSAYRRRWLSSLLFRLSFREFSPICRFSPTCARIWVRVLLPKDKTVRSSFQRSYDPGCRGLHSSCIADKVPGLWKLL
ncbi:unnamed protein product, partial [Brassica rapa subsp. trilocularis]